jgi:cytochrome P450
MEFIGELMGAASKEDQLHLVLVLTGGALLVLFFLRVLKFTSRWIRVAIGTRSVPAAPQGSWLFGHALAVAGSCPWEKMHDWIRSCPPIVRIRLLHRTGVLVGSAQGLKRIFQTRYKIYEKDTEFAYSEFLPILGSGLVTSGGQLWQQQRLLMAPALRIDMLDAILPIAKRAVDRLTVKLQGYRGSGVPVDMEEELRLLTLQVIGEAILSLLPGECDAVFPELYLPVMEESNARTYAPWRYLYPIAVLKYNRRVKALNTYIIKVMRTRWNERQQQKKQGKQVVNNADILDRILEAVEERGECLTPAVETQLCYEIKTFLLAGHETSAAMLTWTLYELNSGLNPEALVQIRKETDAVFGNSSSSSGVGGVGVGGSNKGKKEDVLTTADNPTAGVPSRDAVEGMSYTLSALKESLRKYSVVPVVCRTLAEPDELLGHQLPAGTWVVCHLEAVHHSYKDPLVWRPERFMPNGEYDMFDEDIRPYMFVPFIQGPRNCLGQYFAMLEARVILGLLCKRFHFEPVDKEKQGLTHPTVIPVGPIHGMKMLIT